MRLSIVVAVLAAVLNAVSNLLQRTADRREPQHLELHFGLLWDLAHKPIWLVGIAASTCSFLLMAVALRYGPLALVQPLIVLELPLTLVGAGAVFHVRLDAREWSATALLAAGLAALVGFLAPRAGAPHAPGAVWALGVGTSGALAALLVVVALGTKGGRRAALFGAAAGILFGLSAALMKGMTWRFPDGPLGVLSAWQTYAMIVSGVLAFLVFQSALIAGDLVAAQPGVSLLDPCTALLWAVFAFREPINGSVHMILAIAGGLVMGAGAVVIARSPLLAGSDPVPSADPGGGG
ncbi:MAG TPA: DMT family transporter [Actinomycetota bacterium]|nr:DMT family transporter [Actinomycetota bacterium]